MKIMPSLHVSTPEPNGQWEVVFRNPETNSIMDIVQSEANDPFAPIRVGYKQLLLARELSKGFYKDLEDDIAGYEWLNEQDDATKSEYIKLRAKHMPVPVRTIVQMIKDKMKG